MKFIKSFFSSSTNKRASQQKIISIIFFLVGVSFILYPWVDQALQKIEQMRLLTQWDESQRLKQSAQHDSKALEVIQPMEDMSPMIEDITPLLDQPISIDGQSVLGVLTIEKVEMREPIIEGAGEATLKVGVGTVEADRSPGQLNNFVLAGHRSRTFGNQFNRLAELDAGDTIVINTESKRYVYSVTSTFIVQEDDLSVLEQEGNLAELTLITCEYDQRKKPTQRLIVKAHLEPLETYGG